MSDFENRLQNTRVGFIGGGKMAFAIAKGFTETKVFEKITAVSGPHPEKLKLDWEPISMLITAENWKVVQACNVIFICCKPTQLKDVVRDINAAIDKFVIFDKLFVSVLAGTSKAFVQTEFGLKQPELRLVRLMPNICVQVQEGSCVVAANSKLEDSQQDAEFINYLMNRLGTSEVVPEDKIDAYGALAGSGPAYIFLIIDALADGAVKQGIPRQSAIEFAAQTVCGAAKTVQIMKKHPAVLRDEVCSPGGTTIAGIHELEKGGVRAAIMSALERSTQRSKELQKKD